jgi:hypothetical protein
MNIKSLLLGSAAALVAVSGARAADAVVAPEPEPVEYVRVCDTYGAGYFYIPGTEVCLKVGGYVRYDIGAGDISGAISDTGDDTWYKRARFRLAVDARTETEYGTLEGDVGINFDYTNSNVGGDYNGRNGEALDHAWIKLGGFQVGMGDSFFVTWTDYVGDIIQDTLIPYGPFSTHQISYTFDAGNGFSIGAAVEDGSDNDAFSPGAIDDYAPHALVGLKYATGIISAAVVGAWDSANDGYAIKGKLTVTPNDVFSVFVQGGWSDNNDDDATDSNYYGNWGGSWAIWVGGAVNATDRVTLNGLFGYNELGDWAVVANANIVVVPGSNGTAIGRLYVQPEIEYKHIDDVDGLGNDDDVWGGFLRTQFNF